jgi:hypothetical protein
MTDAKLLTACLCGAIANPIGYAITSAAGLSYGYGAQAVATLIGCALGWLLAGVRRHA